ncbi:MAG: hypothetical protein WAM14_17830 [Candidatus Nitrosopolaris sp.]
MFKGHTPIEEKIIKKAEELEERLLSMVHEEEDNFVKFNAIIYLLNDFFVAEILKGKIDLRGMERSLGEASKQMMERVKKQTSGTRYIQVK